MRHTFQSLQVDKAASLAYVRELLARLDAVDDPEAECLHEAMTGDNLDRFVEEGDPHIVPFTHRLCVVCVSLEDVDGVDTMHVDDCVDAFKQALRDGQWDDTDSVRVYKGSRVVDDAIALKAYLHDTAAECDVSYPKFTYNPVYGMWMIVDDFWGAPRGIDAADDSVWVLSFHSVGFD
jgi:hypothetical protein